MSIDLLDKYLYLVVNGDSMARFEMVGMMYPRILNLQIFDVPLLLKVRVNSKPPLD